MTILTNNTYARSSSYWHLVITRVGESGPTADQKTNQKIVRKKKYEYHCIAHDLNILNPWC